MKITIITSVYNKSDTIGKAIESVISQTYNNIEYIVVDGNSTDGTIDIIKNFWDRIDKFISEKDKGIYDALNKGIKAASGDVIGFLHSDDLFFDEFVIEKIANAFNKYNVDGVYGDLIYTYKHNTGKILRYWKSSQYRPDMLKKGWMPPHTALFLKKSVYDKFGGFDLDFKISADYDFMLRVLKDGIKIKYIPETICKMRVGGESNKSLKNIIRKSNEDLRALRKNNIGGIVTLFIKNFSKITQFLKK